MRYREKQAELRHQQVAKHPSRLLTSFILPLCLRLHHHRRHHLFSLSLIEPGALRRAQTLPIKMEEGREEEEEGGEETLSRVGQERVHTNSEQNGPGRLKSNGKGKPFNCRISN